MCRTHFVFRDVRRLLRYEYRLASADLSDHQFESTENETSEQVCVTEHSQDSRLAEHGAANEAGLVRENEQRPRRLDEEEALSGSE